MVDGKENYKFDLGVKGLSFPLPHSPSSKNLKTNIGLGHGNEIAEYVFCLLGGTKNKFCGLTSDKRGKKSLSSSNLVVSMSF